MLDTFRKGQRWLTGIFVFVIGGVFVFFLGLGGNPMSGSQPTGEAVIEIGDITVSRSDYLRTRAEQVERFREALGDQLDSKGAASFIDSQTMRQLVDAALMSHAAEDLGLMVTRSEIQQYLRGAKQFHAEDGRFATEAFEGWVEYNFGSQRAFMALMRQDLLRAKLRRLLFSQPSVTEAEARNAAMHRLESVVVGYVSLDANSLPPNKAVSDDEIANYLAESEDEVRATYDQRLDVYQKPEARKARHILFQVERTADEAAQAQARTRAEEAMQRIVDGATFEDVALELSEDAGSRDKGGDIGYVIRDGEAAPELVEMAFSVEPGGAMQVIQTDAGFHVVRVDEKREESNMPFEQVSLEIAGELAAKSLAKEYADNTADELAAAVSSGKSLKDAALAAGIPYERSPSLRRRADGYMPEIGTSTDLMATAFSLTTENPSSTRVFAVDDQRTLIELIERQSPEASILEEETLAEKDTLLNQKRTAIMQTWLEDHRATVNANNQLRIDPTIAGS